MIIASREQANKLLAVDSNLFKNDERNIIPGDSNIEVRALRHGKPAGRENLTAEQRKIIAEEAIISGKTIVEIAEQFGISHDTVAAYKSGATSCATYNEKDEDLSKHINSVKENIISEAQNKLLTAIQEITSDKIGAAKVRDIAGIAKDMSSIVKNMGPEMVVNDNRKVIIYRPRERQEDEYEVIDVSS
jgi:transposase-like protein